jgi:hypothetical protein
VEDKSGDRIEELELINQEKDLELSLEQKKALIAEAKRRYGTDWKKYIPGLSGNINSGIDWNSLKFTLRQ